MADNSQSTDDVGTNTQTARSVLLKRNPHLRVNDTSSPAGFGGLGTRQFLQKQLMTPGSATSASSFEEGASYDGFSDAGTPASEDALTQVKAGTSDVQYVSHTTKQPTKRLSSPSRESLARRLMGTSTEKHGMLPDDESVSKVREEDNGLLNNLVVKTVPSISTSTTMVPLSPRSTKVTRRIVASPRTTLRRVVIRKTGADGKVHEQVQYVDADGQVVQQGGNFFNAETEDKSAVQISTPAKSLRRVVVRRTGADGQIHEEVQFLDADGNVVESKSSTSSTTSSVTSTPIRSTLTRRTLRRSGPDGKVYEQIQFLDAEGNVVKTEGDDFDSIPSSSTVVTRTVTPGKKTRRVIVRRTGADGQMHEEVQYLDTDGNVVSTEGSQSSGVLKIDTTTTEGSETQSTTKVTRRVIRRILVRKDGTRVEQLVDTDGNVIESDSGNLVSAGSFTGSVSSVTSDTSTGNPSRRVVTRRVVASPVRRKVVHSTGSSSSGAESEEEMQYEGGELSSSQRSGRRIVTRRVVTPQRVVRRMVTRKGVASSDDELDIDAEFVHSEGSVSGDESIGGSSRGGSSRGYTVSDRIVIPGTTRVVSRDEKVETTSNQTVIVAEPQQGQAPALENDAFETPRSDEEKAPVLTGSIVIESSGEIQTPSDNIVDASEVSKSVKSDEDAALAEIPTSSKVVTAQETTTTTQDEPRRSGGGFWGFFKSEADEDKDPSDATGKDVVECRSIPNNEQKSSPEDVTVESGVHLPPGNTVIPAVAAGVVGAAIIANASSPEAEPIESHSVQAEGEISVPETPAKPVEVDQPKETGAGGGFWGFFGKSDEPKDSDKKAAPVDAEVCEAEKETSDVDFVQEDASPPRADAVLPVAAAVTVSAKPDEASELIVPSTKTEEVEEESHGNSEPKEPQQNAQIETVVVDSVSSSATGAPAAQKSDNENITAASLEDTAPTETVQLETSEASESSNVLQTAAVVRFADVEAVDSSHPVVTTAEESEPADVPHRKTGRSIWKFWGANTPSPIRVDDNTTKGAAAGLVVTETTQTTVVEEEFESGQIYHDAVALSASQRSNEPQEAAAVASVATVEHSVEIEAVRRSISSSNSPTNIVPVESSGKFIRDSERRTTELMDGVEPDIEADDHYIAVASPRHLGSHSEEGRWAVKPCSLTWSSLHLKSKDDRYPVLEGVSGSVKAGEFLVITGPSKHESLALLSCLAGFEDAMEGNVTVNGRKWNEKMNRYVAFVMREDLFFETLTVYEHLLSQAKLRMRRTHTDEMLLERVERVIEDLELSNCRDKLIGGGVSLTGITPGERKLLALATSLLTNPSILLVEEPTYGLDTFSSEKIVSKLRWLAFEKGLTVAVTLHHPSSHFYGLFDVLYLVTNASCVYDGKASDAVAYFSTIGYSCPEFMSPMDYFLLQIGGNREDDAVVARIETLKREWSDRNASVYAENEARAAATSEDAVVDDYDQKNRFYHMSCCGQLGLFWMRHVRRLSRYGFAFWWHLLAALLIGVVFGLVYLQLDLDNQHGIQNFTGSFFYIIVIQLLFTAYRTFVFMPRETAIALRERQEYRGSWYHLLCWYFTKIIAELPALIILSIVLFVPVFLLVGIGHGFKVYVYMQIVLVLAGWSAIGLGFLSLGVFRDVTLALIVYSVLLVLFVVFGGLFINVTDIPDWLVWLHYISPVKYAYEAMMKIFWKRVDSIDCDWTLEGCVALVGEGVLKYYSMESRSGLGDALILLTIGFSFFFFAFWFLLMLANKRISGLQWRYYWSFKGLLGSYLQRIANVTTSEKHTATRTSAQRVLEKDNYYIQVETPRIGGGACDAPAITLGWSSLSFTTEKKELLLTDASGSAKSGELVLITGPSDESNVALLESIGGLQKRVKGKMTLNGVVSSAQKVSECSAYVVRDDLFYETLTVEEHLKFQAELVFAGYERVEMVLDELELTDKRHMLIRYLSPADTKLLAVATALLTNPSILLVEEPTCGMDFYASEFVVLKLRQLAREGRTVVVSMSHPSSHLYALFDSLYLLAGGAAVYHGKVREAVSYFASLGYQCPQYMSPVDYFVRQLTVRGKESETNSVILFKEAWSTRNSELCITDSEEPAVESGHRHRIGCCSQFSLLFRRHLLRLSRYRVVFGWHAFWMVVLGVIFGLIFLQLDLDEQRDIQNWAGAFFYLIVLQMLVIAYRTFVFLPKEMAVAEREHRFGGYFMVCWYLTKLIAELPAMLLLSVLLFVPAYLLIGIGHGFKLFIYMQFVMWLAGWSAAGLVTLMLGLFRRVRVALITFVLLLLLFVVFGGLLINVDDVPDFLIWLHYISPVKYGYEALMKLFWGRIFFLACGGSDGSGSGSVPDATVGDGYDFGTSGSGSYGDDGCIAHSGDEVLSHYSMDNSRNSRSDSVILLELTVLYFFIGYVFLSLRWRRYKREQRSSTQN
ncbi:putative ABC transporter ATP-binding protein/permease [Phytophthora citrophthora]|uniref:ABC transporter ATP-binding protein/permease n=1 Tax=Phytophthora citrophthora TaxID=4793 RepID=A0AAD9GQ80_9STRA|nr:putative ABC transporter ATP-binding protein/permease [Phytophthora citrophthora]